MKIKNVKILRAKINQITVHPVQVELAHYSGACTNTSS